MSNDQRSMRRMALRSLLVVGLVEMLVRLVLLSVDKISATQAVLAGGGLFAVFALPAVYFWVVKPFAEDQEALLAKMVRLAHTDPLTHLANRRRISERLSQLSEGSRRRKDGGALFIIDLDGFKAVNDALGHEAGDAVLIAIANRLRGIMRCDDSVGRLGGDEFVVLATNLGGDPVEARRNAAGIGAKIMQAVAVPVPYRGGELRVKASVGVRLLGFDGFSWEGAIAQADAAMYRAKNSRRLAPVFYDESPVLAQVG